MVAQRDTENKMTPPIIGLEVSLYMYKLGGRQEKEDGGWEQRGEAVNNTQHNNVSSTIPAIK